jgi:hypothetical protein
MIYRVTIPNFINFNDDLIRRLSGPLTEVAKWSTRQTESGAVEGFSELVNKDKLDQLTAVLVREGVQYAVEDHGDEYLHVKTTAPEAYDYPYTIQLVNSDKAEIDQWSGKPIRHVAVQKERKEYQFGRYSSGLYGAEIVPS